MATLCAASPLPTVAAPSLDKVSPGIAVPVILPVWVPVLRAAPAPAGRIAAYSPPSTVNIRFCTFQN